MTADSTPAADDMIRISKNLSFRLDDYGSSDSEYVLLLCIFAQAIRDGLSEPPPEIFPEFGLLGLRWESAPDGFRWSFPADALGAEVTSHVRYVLGRIS